MSKIVLPKSDETGKFYVSYSQLSTWKKSKREYIRQYFFGESFDGNAYTEFGSKIGQALENNDFSEFTKEEQKILKTIPRYDEFEREIKLDFGDFYVKGFIDTSSKPNKKGVAKIADYKTGDKVKKAPEYQSDDYTQLDIYAAALEQEFGNLPESVIVYLIDRKGNAFQNEELVLGDGFITITKDVNPKRIEQVKKDILKTVKEISEYYQVFLKLNGLM